MAMQTRIDHLIIGAATLEQGATFVEERLGVAIPYGGVHEKMGTHNRLLQLGDGVYLEVLAVNPDGEPPDFPRWCGLDDPHVSRQLIKQPTFLTWVVNTNDIEKLLRQAVFSFGRSRPLSRGHLSWYFGLPDDGRLLAGGMLPYVIEWRTDSHPSTNMADAGCRFRGLEIHHPYPSWLRSVLESIGAAELVRIHPLQNYRSPYLVAHFETPAGPKDLRSDTGAFDRSSDRNSH
jgi:hypothetical protein